MAFNLNNFAESQITRVQNTLSAENIINKVTPTQVKQIIDSNPVETVNNTWENISGIKLGKVIAGVGKQYISSVTSYVKNSLALLEAQIFGCINKVIRDFFNDNPILEKVILFDQTINQALSKIRNTLNNKIDLEIRKIGYKKINVLQTVQLKLKVSSAINKICPGASPASPSQAKQYRNIVNGLFESNSGEGEIVDSNPSTTLSVDEVTTRSDIKNFSITEPKDISTTVLKKLKTDPTALQEFREEALNNAQEIVVAAAIKQGSGYNTKSWEEIYGN